MSLKQVAVRHISPNGNETESKNQALVLDLQDTLTFERWERMEELLREASPEVILEVYRNMTVTFIRGLPEEALKRLADAHIHATGGEYDSNPMDSHKTYLQMMLAQSDLFPEDERIWTPATA